MKTTIDIPDSLFRKTKSTAALRGESLRDFIVAAIKESLSARPRTTGWRTVFGKADGASVSQVDAVIHEEFSKIDLRAWE